MYWFIYISCAILIGLFKALHYVTITPYKQENPIKIFALAWLVATIFAPLVIIDFIIGGIKGVKLHKQNIQNK